jgi:hypothetical protein
MDLNSDEDEIRQREVLEAIRQKVVDENVETEIRRIDGLLELSDQTPNKRPEVAGENQVVRRGRGAQEEGDELAEALERI